MPNGNRETLQLSRSNSIDERAVEEDKSDQNQCFLKVDSPPLDKGVNDVVIPVRPELGMDSSKKESVAAEAMFNDCDSPIGDVVYNKQPTQKHIPNAILPLLRYQQCDSSDSSSSDDRNFRSDLDSAETDEASFSGQEDNEHNEIIDWAKTNNHGSLQIICEYNRLCVPARGSTIKFHPLEHLHPLEFHRPDETVLHMAGSTIDLMSCNTSYRALAWEEEATAFVSMGNFMHMWFHASWAFLDNICGCSLEKQIVFVCSNLGILSASVLSIIPLIRLTVLPNDMLDFLDAPVPFIVGVKSKTAEVQSKSANVILVDANKNQVEAAKGFLKVLRSYLDSLCSNLRSHTITNVQSNDDKVSLLLKESFIESFPSRDRPFMKLLSITITWWLFIDVNRVRVIVDI
ncbi:hypothetical protein OSB04_031267 [Centaurea solstitialis]|uniref:cDENN domain-containing protein n=1 Tax=Centaurea solstitialis TaxID=347529 RepID=A0AA38W5U0_9ASTR|nr:hypothetical protein OSB04_031267 [Centaurea solstitialis]